MKKLLIPFLLFISLNNKVSAELEINMNEYYPISAETIKLTKQGILLGEYDNKYPSTPFNGIYFDETGNFTFKPKVLKSYKITDLDEDANHYFATSYMVINGQQGVFKISKDFSKIENLGLKAAMRRVHQYKNKIYYGGITHGCYVVNKDGTGNAQILGDGYYGPYIDDIKSNSKNVYILSRGLLYKVNYENNSKEQLIFGLRPSSIELDEDRIYFISSNKFYYLSYDNKLSNEKIFKNNLTFLKKHQNIIILVESDGTNSFFWISKDLGKNFFKSKTSIPAFHTIKDIELVGDKSYTVYLNLSGKGLVKGNLIFDFEDAKVFSPPFKIGSDSDLVDKISAFFDHNYPYLGNSQEPEGSQKTTLNYRGQEMEEPYMYYSSHDGIDWALPLNTPIFSVSEGWASYFYQENGLGHAIKISHPNGYVTIYGHLSSDDLITKQDQIYVSKGQKIGKIGMSGRTTGPHLHFTTYRGEKILSNKVDPFGWEPQITDPWSQIGSSSKYLWSNKSLPYKIQFNSSEYKTISLNKLNLEIMNLNFLKQPISMDIERVAPIYDSKNYQYLADSSFFFNNTDLISETIPSTVLGFINYSGFKYGEDKMYSIWKVTENNVDKLETFYVSHNNSLSTLFEPNAQYLVLKDNFKKIKIKNKTTTN